MVAIVRREGESSLDPGQQATIEVHRVEPRLYQQRGDTCRASPRTAHDDDPPVMREIAEPVGHPIQGKVPCTQNVPGFPFVYFPYVHQDRALHQEFSGP